MKVSLVDGMHSLPHDSLSANYMPALRGLASLRSVRPTSSYFGAVSSSPMSHFKRTLGTHRELDSVLDFMRLLWSIEHGLQRLSKKMEAELGVTGPQRLVLRIVGQFPGMSASELAHILRLHPSTITGILKRLVAKGWLERRQDPSDTRRVQLLLKAQAVRFTRMSRGTVEYAVTTALARAGANNVRMARRVLTEIAQHLDDV